MAAKIISSQELSEWLKEDKKISILDVRPLTEREEWYIPGSIHLNAYDEIKTENLQVLSNLTIDKDLPVITVCGRGVLSLSVAEALSNSGYDAYSLKGGMKAWNYAHDYIPMEFENFKIIQVRRLAKGCLSYLIGSDGKAMVIDASLAPEVYNSLAEKEGWEIIYVTDTHIHADYVSRTIELASYSGATHLMNSRSETSFPFRPLTDGEIIELGEAKIKTIHTPGHTWESTCFLVEQQALLSGDTLFADGIGRPDLKSDKDETVNKTNALYESLQIISRLPDTLLILPAHVSKPIETKQPVIGEKLTNLKNTLRGLNLDKEQFLTDILSKLPPPPPNYETIAGINKSGQRGDHNIADLEAGANRCAIR